MVQLSSTNAYATEDETEQGFEMVKKRRSAYPLNDQYQRVFENFEKGLEIAKKCGDMELQIESYLGLAHAYRLNDQYQMAIEYYEKGLEITKECGDKERQTEGYLGLGRAYQLNDQYDRAIESYMKGLEIAEQRVNKEQETEANLRLENAYKSNCQFSSGIEHSEVVLKFEEENGDKRQETAYIRQGHAYKSKETLENCDDHESSDALERSAKEIIRQVLKGLTDLYHGPKPIYHRDLKLSNVLRNVLGKWSLADFVISRKYAFDLSENMSLTDQMGAKYRRAVEPSGCSATDGNVCFTKESDIQVAGMIAYYIVTKAKHPFGERELPTYLYDFKPVGLDKLEDPALKDLLTWMLSHDPKDRPSAEEALEHPYFLTKEQQFELLCNMGNQPEISTGDINSDVVRQLNSDPTDWRTSMNANILKYLSLDFFNENPKTLKYGSSWTECVRFMRNFNKHWKDRSRPTPQPEAFVDPQEYFLNVFPNLPLFVHKIVRSSDWKERPELQKFFIAQGQDRETRESNEKSKESANLEEETDQILRNTSNKNATKEYWEGGTKLADKLGDDKVAKQSLNLFGTKFDDQNKTVAAFNLEKEEKAIGSAQKDATLAQKECNKVKVGTGEDDQTTFLEKYFLDDEYNIKEEVHEKFKRFTWLCGAYGVSGPNEKICYPHLYVTIERGKNESDVLQEIEEVFCSEAKNYFELRREPKEKPEFSYLCGTKPSFGGGIIAVNNANTSSPLRIMEEEEVEESDTLRATGTLTMFCSQNGNHYALTCFHVSLVNDEQLFNVTFNGQKVFEIRKSIDPYKVNAGKQGYYYRRRGSDDLHENENINPVNDTLLGEFARAEFHSKCDIMSIKVCEDAEIDCQVSEVDSPEWKEIWRELFERVVLKSGSGGAVVVEKHGYSTNITHGRIVERNFTYKHQGELLFQDAIAIEGISETFLKPGDSGALIFFLDENDRKKPFAYGVCEVDKIPIERTSFNEDTNGNARPDILSTYSDKKNSLHSNDVESSENTKRKAATSEEGASSSQRYEARDGNGSDSDDESIIFSDKVKPRNENRPLYICLKLDTALNNLKLSNAGCFKECGGLN